MDVVRSFIAISLPDDVRAELTSLEYKLKARQHPFVKWVDPESMHLTLRFLGNVAIDYVPEIAGAMSRVAYAHPPFKLQVAGTGAFPNWQRPQVVWVGVGGELDRLNDLQNGLESELSPLGFPPESRLFSAHLTLGRLRDRVTPDDRRRFAEFAQMVEFKTGLSFDVSAIRLMKSQLTPSGPIYSELAVAELGSSQPGTGTGR
ncbi:MAG: RNA 2',3'-cyclic phosphodiesterase [Dehalococcoidia bacterium]|nr:RNA 2',3'-cyclic phosphodiesterase [Dehalococcoidia bacterium]